MKQNTSKQIRQMWLDFWKSKDHEILESKSLIPVNDPSILWINSGVSTLKDYFSGLKIPTKPNITNSQKCIRTNDIDNVGLTARHHTLFEMLGNFSIGGYFKDKALEWAYEFIFDVLKLEKDKIYITYFPEDEYTYKKWIDLGIDKKHLIKGDKETNFWEIGEGPCGPDTEIFYDRGEKYDHEKVGLKLLENDIENDRYIEIWNIVFSQFNKNEDGSYTELTQKNIDTGAGLERIVSIMQDVPTNFDTDLFIPIIKEVEKMTDKKYDTENYFIKNKEQSVINKHFKIIADHIRAISHAINDGASPSNTQRGYIIRRLLRRAYRSGIQLGITDTTFLHKLVDVVQEVLDVYKIDKESIKKIIKKEEETFSNTIKQGEKLLYKTLEENKEFDFSVAYKLFETYGFPIELTKELLDERGVSLNLDEFKKFQDEHAKKSKSNKVTKAMQKQIQVIQKVTSKVSEFIGYEKLSSNSNIIFQESENNRNYVLLDETPFYATSGGQVHDIGTLNDVEVKDVFKDKYNNHWHILDEELEGVVSAEVDEEKRSKKARNHSGTHLLGHALREVIGPHVVQLGSENNEKRLRFDFPYDKRLTNEEIKSVEDKVKELISSNIKREYIIDTFENGLKIGALALEGEIDNDPKMISRIVKFDKSIEFCGGTHVTSSKELQDFKIIKLESKGSGTYRIEALTSKETIDKYNEKEFNNILLKAKKSIEKNKKLDEKYTYELSKDIDGLNKDIENIKKDFKDLKQTNSNVDIKLDIEFTTYKDMKAYINLDVKPQTIKTLAIKLRNEHKDSLIILVSKQNNQSLLAVASDKYNSKEIFDEIANKNNGQGGGNETFAMGKTNIIKKI